MALLDYRSKDASELSLAAVIRPLWFVFAGGLICFVDLSVTIRTHGPHGLTFRPTWRPLGAALLAWGLWQIARYRIDREFDLLIRLILGVAIVQGALAVADFFPLPAEPLILLTRIFIGIATQFASIGFCRAMRWFCVENDLRRSATGWRRTTLIFCCYCIPAALFQVLMLFFIFQAANVHRVAATKPSASVLWWFLLILPFMVAPPVAFVVNVLSMRREMMNVQVPEPRITVPVY